MGSWAEYYFWKVTAIGLLHEATNNGEHILKMSETQINSVSGQGVLKLLSAFILKVFTAQRQCDFVPA